MLSNPTSIRPSSLLKWSTTRPADIHSSRPILFRRVGFTRSTDFSCRRSHLESFPKKITTTRKSISPPNNKPEEIDGMAASTPADEDERLSEEAEKKVSNYMEGLSSEEVKKEVSDHMEGRSDIDKEILVFLLCHRKEWKQIMLFIVGLLGKDKKKIEHFVDGLDEEEFKTKFRDFLKDLNEEEKKALMSALDFVPRIGFIKKVFGILAAQSLLGTAAYTAMKMNPTISAALQQNYFYLFSLLFTGGLFLSSTLKAFKDMSSVGEKSILNSIFLGLFNVAIVSIGVVLADIHLASSNGLVMVGAFVSTLAMFAILTSLALVTSVEKSNWRRDLGTALSSSSTVTLAVIASFIQIVNPGPISAAIDIGFNGFIFCLFVIEDVWTMMKSYKDDDSMKASSQLFLDFYGLFIVSIKAFGMLSGFFIFSNKVFGMLYALLISSITTFMK